ncbi:hypothetical protein ACFWIJ_06755 [Streptomyces sp. NPDC127079]|uniref:hypothetical protein n=1 Tax=Streptomyces sp. NPDC127079 TaxID=3347132 RepID=UPI0036509C5D
MRVCAESGSKSEGHVSSSSTLYRVREPLPDAVSALSRARAIMRDLTDWTAEPWPHLDKVTTVEQTIYAPGGEPEDT